MAKRLLRCLLCASGLIAATALKADVVLFQDFFGTGKMTVPAYYIGGCDQGNLLCAASEAYPYSVDTNTIPATAYIGDSGGFVSDEIQTTVNTTNPDFSFVTFQFFFGKDLDGLTTCASVADAFSRTMGPCKRSAR
jgi:hypothetical protein